VNFDHPEGGHPATRPPDPEQYIRNLERGGAPTPSGGQFGGPWLGGTRGLWFLVLGKLLTTPRGRMILTVSVPLALVAVAILANQVSRTTVHGNLIMINSGATQTIECNNGNVKLDGDNNTYTIKGHCGRLEIFGGANHVVVDHADTVSIVGDDNEVIYRSGSPRINKTGNNDTVFQRPITH
jgi:Protein of unknown function (DUF3060)